MAGVAVAKWSCEDVRNWLIESGFSKYAEDFCDKHRIDGEALLSLQESDLRQPPLQICVLGDIKKIFLSIKKLQEENSGQSCGNPVGDYLDNGHGVYSCSSSKRRCSRRMVNDSASDGESMEEEVARIVNKNGRFSRTLEPEVFKTFLSFLYAFCVFLLTSFVMVISHDRVPDPAKYPPLPDLFLDNIPLMPWAFEICELVCTFMLIVWCFILFFHKHRFILLRRMFSMLGTVFLLRCVTMVITSLSVPGVHLQCDQKFGSWYAKFMRTYEIWSGFGMSIHGVKSCGDYMFSGHTSIITLLNFFITEYAPRNMYYLHTTAWVSNLFGIFFILAAHEHYSIDVFIAFYITSRLFLYYHTLANNRSLMLRDKWRRKVWFPLFSYFESQCDGIVPNEYEWPLPYPKSFKRYFEKKVKRR